MKNGSGDIMPRARRDNLVIEELADETLVYDLLSNKAHCLNRTASRVFRHCDGRTSLASVTKMLQGEVDKRLTRDAVLLAIDRLEKSGLLQEPVQSGNREQPTRREVIRKLGWAAAVSLPLVTSIVAPTAASAATCIPADQCSLTTCNQPCHSTGNTDCTKICRPRGDKLFNCNDPRAWQCVGQPAGPCDC